MSFVDTWHAVLRAAVSLLSGLFADGPGAGDTRSDDRCRLSG
ncbi:hypothetical protein ACFORO_18835 [Amycolatopsis halotolerans]|uniref:Uncharacterized protein n=2 Tax=Amycolatopsis halotolerans TaxID=330083 RepID=A0ABV7QG10_9PSEU